MVTVGGKTRWVCGKKPPKDALKIYARKLSAWQDDETPLPAPEVMPESPTLREVMNRWLIDRRGDSQRGELGGGTFQQYRLSIQRIAPIAGHIFTDDINPDIIKSIYTKIHAKHGEDAARRAMSHLRSCAREAEDRGWCRPMRIGKRNIAKLTARDKPKMKWKLYTPPQLRQILLACNRRIRTSKGRTYREPWEQLKAMILLALNGGYGARELSQLPRPIVDLDARMIDYRRGKTNEDHVVPLWPETVRALRRVMRQRPGDELVFRTREGNAWAREEKHFVAGKLSRSVNHDNVAWKFDELVRPIGLKIAGQSFYKLRHLHATTADAFGDVHASLVLTGHGVPGARGFYVRVDTARLVKLVEYLRHRILFNRDSSASTSMPR